MNRTKLKNYAPQARRDFIQTMTDRAAYYGLTAKKVEPVVERGDVAVIAGREHPRAVAKKRKQLEVRIKRHGFAQTMEAVAYTWFNRLVAIRFMELHGYFDHGYRVLSHPEAKPTPEMLEHAEHVELPGLKSETVIDLKVAGNKEGELYRLLLIAQCNALHRAMPFLFERIDDETELLVPDNLLHSDSLVRKLVGQIDEEDWQEVEIIGWLYQFYISERKDEVIGKVVASEDIPAATQLFTPNWIVKYLVQNTLGRQWLATYPQSALRQQMEYYIEPAEQTPDVQEQLKALTPTSLNPEDLTLLDPACGSGHILVEAYELFKAIYQERGYRAKDIPALILQKNLFGLEIDARAAQLASFALMMKARADDRHIFDDEVAPSIVAFQDSQGSSAADIAYALNAPINKEDHPTDYLFEEMQEEKDGLFSKKALAEKGCVAQGDIAALLALFTNAKTVGSLIQVPLKLAVKLPEIQARLDDVLRHGDLTHAPAHVLNPLLQQARILSRRYHAVVGNPPYMGIKGMNQELKEFGRQHFPNSKSDLFAMFVERLVGTVSANCYLGLMTPFTWMFLGSYKQLRKLLASDNALVSLIRPEYHAFFDSAYVPICLFTIHTVTIPQRGVFIDLGRFYGEELQEVKALEAIASPNCEWRYVASSSEFALIPGSPIAYWVSPKMRAVFATAPPLSSVAEPRVGLQTGDNDRFLRLWQEVDFRKIGRAIESRCKAQFSGMKWFPCNKGGAFRKWYGNNEYLANWEHDGREIRNHFGEDGKLRSRPQNVDYYFRRGITWSTVSSSSASFRLSRDGRMFETKGAMCFPHSDQYFNYILGMLNTKIVEAVLKIFSPTLDFHEGPMGRVPVVIGDDDMVGEVTELVNDAIAIATMDFDEDERSMDFERSPLLSVRNGESGTVGAAFLELERAAAARRDRMKGIEGRLNSLFLDAYGLQDELSPEVLDDQITLYRPERAEDSRRLLCYAIGCMMGRYSLDKPGLIYADSGNRGFDPDQYRTFRADDDGIVSVLETDRGIRNDGTKRIVEFAGEAWPKEHLDENLKFIADGLGPFSDEQPTETIRRYLATGFYKHHLSMYKKRPIYWLFSSGKQRAFQCLVYLHRYHEGTLARMRTEYVIPLQGQIAARIEQLEGDKAKATSTSHRNKLQNEQNDLKKQRAELLTFEERLKHAADQRISLDLDDGVKVNYGKFGDLLAEARGISGGNDDE